jgi:hypothetical protein
VKKYYKAGMVTAPIGEENIFYTKVGALISQNQSEGFEVEIQYQANNAGYSALILSFKNE